MRASDLRLRTCAAACAVLFTCCAGVAHAADKDNREREALRRAQQTASKLQAEKAAVEREKVELTSRLDTATRSLDGLKGGLSQAKKRALALERELETLRTENGELKSRVDALTGNLAGASRSLDDTTRQCQEAAAAAKQNEQRAERVQVNLKTLLGREEADRKSCQTNNLKLRTIAHEILDRYQNKGVFRGVLQADPLVGLKSVEIENLVQDYGDRIDDLKAVAPVR